GIFDFSGMLRLGEKVERIGSSASTFRALLSWKVYNAERSLLKLRMFFWLPSMYMVVASVRAFLNTMPVKPENDEIVLKETLIFEVTGFDEYSENLIKSSTIKV
ncbi:MAG: hypothetical protein V8S58_06335, partial [Lachnospiraceae bacterium]